MEKYLFPKKNIIWCYIHFPSLIHFSKISHFLSLLSLLSLSLPCSFQGKRCTRMRGWSIVSGIFCGCWWLCGLLGGSLPEKGDSEQQGLHTGSPRTLWKDVSSILKAWNNYMLYNKILTVAALRHFVRVCQFFTAF